MNKHIRKRDSFSGKMGYVLTVAGAAVGLGNLWRFPYLAAKYGGGIFVLIYLILMITFGYALIISETVLGKMTKKSPVGAFAKFGKTWPFKFGGWINAIVPILIAPYYAVVGGWVARYLFEYLKGNDEKMAKSESFSNFIANPSSSMLWFLVFTITAIIVVSFGVKKGVENISKFAMPLLIVLSLGLSVFSMTQKGAMEGIKYFLVPNFDNFSWMTIVAALGQMFFSLSIGMGVLYTFGSYMTKDTDINKATREIELFDTGIALLAGLMIIPAVFAFVGKDGLTAGAGLMFITMPKVFLKTGVGSVIGSLFFVLVFFAALTSAVALIETAVSTFIDQFKLERMKAVGLMTAIMVGLGTLSALGYNSLGSVKIIGMQFLDFFDFLTNSVMMPISAFATCALVVTVVGIEKISKEVSKDKSGDFRGKTIYKYTIKYFAPACLIVIFVSSIATALGYISF